MKLLLSENWYVLDSCALYGFAYLDNKYFNDLNLKQLLYNSILENRLDVLLNELYGSFSAVISIDKRIYIISDTMRTIPIYYTVLQNDIVISDKIENIVTNENKINSLSELEIKSLGYISGNATLYENIFQTESNCILIYEEGSFKNHFYLDSFKRNNKQDISTDKLIADFDKVYRYSFSKLINYLDGNKAVIPLSDGIDSRIILHYLCELGYRNILTFTYGSCNSKSTSISHKIASKYNVEWICIPYGDTSMRRLFNESFSDMSKHYGLGICVPVIQDWFAIDYMIKHGYIDSSCIIIPGHAITSIYEFIKNDLDIQVNSSLNGYVEDIFDANYVFSQQNQKKKVKIKDKIQNEINRISGQSSESLLDLDYTNILFRYAHIERQSKFIVSSIRTYTYYGLKYYLPLYDTSIINFWSKIPDERTKSRKLYEEIVSNITSTKITVKKIAVDSKKEFVLFLKKFFPRIYIVLSGMKRRSIYSLKLDYYFSFFSFLRHLIARRYRYLEMWMYRYLELSRKAIKE